MTSTMSTLVVTPTGGRLGAEVEGFDLSRDLTADQVEQLRSALAEHLVLVFPGQSLDDESQLRFALNFGDPYVHPLGRAHVTEPRCEHIVDDVDHPPYQDYWHTDVTWDPEPPTFGTLRIIDRPTRGGDTIFANMYAAYDDLSPTMAGLLEPLRAIHTMGVGTAFITKAGPEAVAKARAAFPGAEQPVIGVHPWTNRRFVNVNATFTEAIVGLSPTESSTLLDLLCAHAADPNIQYRHQWRDGDVVIWDERCTQHFAVADYMPQRREMGRVAVR